MPEKINDILDDIKNSINEIEESLQGLGFDDYRNNRGRMIYVVNRLESIFGNIDRIDSDFRSLHPEVQWEEVLQYRNMMLKGNSGIDEKEVWTIAKIKLVKLKKILDSIH
jgi:uncharacterized protein with HEPN domain